MKRVVLQLALITSVLLGSVAVRRAWVGRSPEPIPQASLPAQGPVGAIQEVAPRLYMVPGAGGNTAVFVAAGGLVLVDPKFKFTVQELMNEVRRVTDKPVTHIINTHCHGDHVGGNSFFQDVEIIAHEGAEQEMQKMWASASPPSTQGLPTRTFKDRLTILDGPDAIDLYNFGTAHTGGDTFVVFRSAGVLHAGDVFADKGVPIINLPRGGNGPHYASVLTEAGSTIRGVSKVITGHGPVVSWDEFLEYGEFNRILLSHAKAQAAAGKDEYRALTELRLPAKFTGYDLGRIMFTFDEIYRGLDK